MYLSKEATLLPSKVVFSFVFLYPITRTRIPTKRNTEYTQFHAQQGHHYGWKTTLRDTNGSSLYETDDMALLTTIVERNDVAMLKRYIQDKIDPAVGLHPYSPDCIDPFFTATKHGCIDALRVLLDHYHANINEAEPLEQRGIFLLNLACRYGQLETARFLLDSDPPLGTVQDKAPGGETALLAAAESFVYLSDELEHYHGNDTHAWVAKELARREDLIHMLVDRGASVRDHRDDPPRLRCSVLGLAASRASYALVKRLVDDGADLHAKQ
ncbi:ankyrin repeat domain-containing protein [Aspergillus melleus]|uniref:ankyrin repeat domain-containing protein n=1 Tax=Aspergillus melleus TaxID=138277 RepID=UPI001E8EF03E|nr:uncharacterized protein LDX57_011528 [Aspergillus melleus]KAH8433892.1 hypothetical protein LDX57_011528 [Aspergillus melleus]